jgi:site-specific recombinase XerD
MSVDEFIASLSHPEWLARGPFGTVAGQYVDHLHGQRYSQLTIRHYVGALAHFSYWTTIEQLGMSDVHRATITRFLCVHLPACACPKPCFHGLHEIRAALGHLLVLLHKQGLVQTSLPVMTPITVETEQFGHYLADARGLAASTCAYRLRVVRLFLDAHFGADPVDLGCISPQQVDDWIMGVAKRYRLASLGVVRSSLRSYFRYRALHGDAIERLSAAVPVLANWSESKLLEVMTDEQLERFLQSFDLSRATGLRDYAMARCLSDLGLRGQEVTQLDLANVDWHAGTLTICKTKGHRVRVLPLPVVTGAAIADYLRKGRPKTCNRRLFVRHVAPFDKPLSRLTVGNAMNQAFARSGLGSQFGGTHVLRRTLATRLQRSGSSIKAIADVLGHQELQTAKRYAKVDIDRLRKIALPWPGRQS